MRCKESFKDFKDLPPSLKAGHLYIPSTGDLESADALPHPSIALQVTAASAHKILKVGLASSSKVEFLDLSSLAVPVQFEPESRLI